MLRVFGSGDNRISMCYVDNYCHGLMLAEAKLVPGTPHPLLVLLDHRRPRVQLLAHDRHRRHTAMYGQRRSIYNKSAVPTWLILAVAYLCE
jgi:hypothetical protein